MSRDRKLATIITFTGILLVVVAVWVAGLFAKDLPVLVPLENMGPQYDSQRVSVFGWVRSIEVKEGRRGSNYVEIVLGEGDATVNVYSLTPVYNILDAYVVVQGTYREQGRIAGFLADHFIAAEVIVRDWTH